MHVTTSAVFRTNPVAALERRYGRAAAMRYFDRVAAYAEEEVARMRRRPTSEEARASQRRMAARLVELEDEIARELDDDRELLSILDAAAIANEDAE